MIKGMFDINPRLIGLVVRGVEIRGIDDLEQFIIENEVQIAALTIPKSKAPEIAERLVNAGIKRIVFRGEYPDELSKAILEEADVELVVMD